MTMKVTSLNVLIKDIEKVTSGAKRKTCMHCGKPQGKIILEKPTNFKEKIGTPGSAKETERKRLMNFVVVGGGPTGVEFAAELADLVHGEATKPQKVYVSKTIKRLVDLGLAYQAGSSGEGSRYKQNLFMASGWAVAKHQISF